MPLNPGDLMFVGWDSDNNDIAFITTVDIPAGEVIFFTDDEWDGTSFNGSEQYMEWTVPAGGVSAGTVVTIDMDNVANTATIDAGGNLDYMRGGYSIAGGNEMFWAFQGTRTGSTATPSNFIGVIGNEDNTNYNQSPELSGTGLTTSNGAGNQNPGGGFDVDDQNVVCFTTGTLIETPDGRVAIEDLKIGDMVLTWSGGTKRITKLIQTPVSREMLKRKPELCPVVISAGALGPNIPNRDLQVSPQHRVLVRSKIAHRMFGKTEVLIPAIRLLPLPGVHQATGDCAVCYHHMVLDAHEIVISDGCPTETLFLGPQTIKALPLPVRQELYDLLGPLEGHHLAETKARFVPDGKRQKRLVDRHKKNGKPLVTLH